MTQRPRLVHTPKSVTATVTVSMRSPIQPKILSPMTGKKLDFMVMGSSLQTTLKPHF